MEDAAILAKKATTRVKKPQGEYLFTVTDSDGKVLYTDKDGAHILINVKTPDGKVHNLGEVCYNLYRHTSIKTDKIIGEIDEHEFDFSTYRPDNGRFEREKNW